MCSTPASVSCFNFISMQNLFVLFFLGIFVLISPDQPEIDYQHKRIYKEVERIWGMQEPHLSEMDLPDSITRANMVLGKFFVVTDGAEQGSNYYLYIGRVNSCRSGGCSIPNELDFSSEMEYFDYLICYTSTPSVQSVKVINYMATHGHEVSSKGWLKQFKGYNGKGTLEVGKNIDAIAGATISVYGITQDVQEKTEILRILKQFE